MNVRVNSLPASTMTLGATLDAGPSQAVTRTYTVSANMTTAAAISAAPESGKKLVGVARRARPAMWP